MSFGAVSAAMGLSRQTGCHKQNVQGHLVCLVHDDARFVYDRECPAPRYCGGKEIGQAFKCRAVDVDDSAAFGTSGGEMREHSFRASSWGEEGAPIWHCGLLPSDPVIGIVAGIRRRVGGGGFGLSVGVLTSVMGRVSSEADSLTGAEATLGRSSGRASEVTCCPTARRLKGARGLNKGGGWALCEAPYYVEFIARFALKTPPFWSCSVTLTRSTQHNMVV